MAIVLALGGGGARGLAHLGALLALESENIKFAGIAGTSMGAAIGAAYAQNPDAQQLINTLQEALALQPESAAEQNDWFDDFSKQFRTRALMNGRDDQNPNALYYSTLNHILADTNIEDTQIPFAAITVDAITGQEFHLRVGSIRRAVLASSALPGVMPPVEWDNKLFIDGAATSALPVEAARSLSSDPIVAVDVSSALLPKSNFNNAVDLFVRNTQILARRHRQTLAAMADVIIEPEVGRFHFSDFTHPEHIIEQGRRATLEAMPLIKKLKG